MIRQIFTVLALVFFCFTGLNAGEAEIGNIIIQKTMSPVGHEFYREFSGVWTSPPGSESFNICVQEKADARWGSLITILVDDRIVYRNMLGLRTRGLRDVAEKAANQVSIYVLRYSLTRQQEDEDLADDGY